jgi:hypothetical protein
MNPETKKTILYALLFGGLIAGGVVMYKKLTNKKLSKSDKVIYILTNSGGVGDFGFLITLDELYIDTWYNAVEQKQPNFIIGTEKFSAVTGKKI